MSTINKLSESDLREARKAGYKAKQPKKPKGSSTLKTLENWCTRYNEWARKAKVKVTEGKKKEAEKDKRKKLKEKISRI